MSFETTKLPLAGWELALKILLCLALSVLVVTAFMGNALAVPSPTETDKKAVILSPLERWIPTWHLELYVSNLEKAGYDVDVLLNGNASIGFFKTGLANYDIVILRTDSFRYGGTTYYCSGESVNSTTRRQFAGEILTNEIKVGACLGFSALFLQHHYPANSTRHGLFYAIGSGTAELSWVFLPAGAAAFVGYFEEEYTLSWGRMDALTIKVFSYLSQGYTVRETFIELYVYLNRGHGENGSWPTVYVAGDNEFKI